jgi:DNA-binding winged helix-turn-helix (wHTH) protein
MSVSEFPGGRAGGTVARLPLAHRRDLQLGAATIRPSRRQVEGPAGVVTVEPRVMQVLLELADEAGAVLSRDDLMRRCWPGQVVGDDAINRAIAEVRKVARSTGTGFTVETIARVGYRLVMEADAPSAAASTDGQTNPDSREVALPTPSRRAWLLGSALGVLALSGAGAWFALRPRSDPRVAALIERGRQSLRDELPDPLQQGVGIFEQAVALDPASAPAWGWLALARSRTAEQSSVANRGAQVRAAESAARSALDIDPKEGNALLALALLAPRVGDWTQAEDRIRAAIKVAPDNVAAHAALGTFLQAVGRTRDALASNLRALELDPLLPGELFRAAIKHWTLGRAAESELAIGRAMQLFPRHPAVWNTRLFLYAFTDRIGAAESMLNDRESRPPTLAPPAIELWRRSLQALRTRAPEDVAAAREAHLAATRRSTSGAVNAMMVLSMLGEVDAAYEVVRGYLLHYGSVIARQSSDASQLRVNDQQTPKTMMLFVPATQAMRADARFAALCDELGFSEYWRRRGVRPDYLLNGPRVALRR